MAGSIDRLQGGMTGGRSVIAPLAAMLLACAPPDVASEATTTVGSTSSGLGDELGTSTAPSDCPHRIEGDYTVRRPSDAAGLASVSGVLEIDLDEADPTSNLAFLGCLESVDHLYITSSPAITSLDGMTSLTSVRKLTVTQVPRLTAIHGADWMRELRTVLVGGVESLRVVEFPALERLDNLIIYDAESLEELWFPALRTVGYIDAGTCYAGGASMHSWTSLDGFPAIEDIYSLRVHSIASMAHLEILDSLLENNGTITGPIAVRYNPMLPEAEVLDQLSALGAVGWEVCGNLGSAEDCAC